VLIWRLLLGSLLIAGFVALCWLDTAAARPGVWLGPTAAILCALATQETLSIASGAGMRPFAPAVYAGNLLLLASGFGFWAVGPLESFFLTPSMVLALALGAILMVEIWRYQRPGGATANIAGAMLALAYVGILLSIVAQLLVRWGVGALATLVIVVKMADTGAYTIGRMIGRHKMAPLLSPGKTWEGLAGGFVFALAGSYMAFAWLLPAIGESSDCGNSPRGGWIAYALLVGGAGVMGDLAESLLKRDVGRKNSSQWMPGFGGVLDILDSILLAWPIAYSCWASGIIGA
jgi:phosphatidate cytidylyltransferase